MPVLKVKSRKADSAAVFGTAGEVSLDEHGVKVKKYRGMGSLEAMKKGSESRCCASSVPV